jgi:hypothetical protein
MANQVLTLAGQSDFSLVLGGPLYQLYLRTRLARPPLELVSRRTIAISLICWVPPFILALVAGQVFDTVRIPFLLSLGVHTRFLLALPLLIGSELIVHERMKSLVEQFLERGIICSEARERFEAMIGSAMRLRNSILAEVGIAPFVAAISYWVWKDSVVLGASSWYATSDGRSAHLTAAGVWYAFVSLPILRFILLRWYFRLFVWYRFLWQVRSLPLHLNLFHPDRVGGLGFLSGSVFAFAPVLVAQTVILAGFIGDRIWHAGEHLPSFELEILAVVPFLVLIVLAPLSFFVIQLEKARQLARGEYGILASHYVDDFHRKWMEEHGAPVEPLLGTQDLQSLSDLGNAYNVVSEMRLLPFDMRALFQLTTLVVLPLLPLILTMAPLHDVLARLIKLVFWRAGPRWIIKTQTTHPINGGQALSAFLLHALSSF